MDIRPSGQLGFLLATTHGLALLAAWFVPVALGLGLALLTIGSLVRSLRREALRLAPASVVSIEHQDEDRFRLHTKDGGEVEARLLEGGYVSPWLSLLRFRPDRGRNRSLIILPDAVDAEAYRRFRVLVRRLGA